MILLFFGRAIQVLIAVVTIRLLTELLPEQEIGIQYLINSILMWFSLVLINPVGMFTNRHIHEWKESGELYNYLKQVNVYFLMIAVISVPVVFVLRNYFKIGTVVPNLDLLLFVMFYVYFATWFTFLISYFNLFDRQKLFVYLNVSSQVLGLGFAIASIKLFQPTAIHWMSGLLLGQIAALLMALMLFLKEFPRAQFAKVPAGPGLFSRYTFLFCFPVAVATLFMWFMNQGYRLMIERNMGVEVLASLGIGLGLAMSLATVVEGITTQYLYPKYYAGLANSDLDSRRSAWKILNQNAMIVYIPFCLLTVSVSFLMVRVLVARHFDHVVPYVMFGAFIELLRQLSNIAYIVAHAEKKTKFTILPYFAGACALAVLFGLLVYLSQLEITNVLVCILAASGITYAMNLVVVKKLIQVNLDFRVALQSTAISLPLLLPIFFISNDSSLPVLFLSAAVSGGWCLGSIYLLNKKLKRGLTA